MKRSLGYTKDVKATVVRINHTVGFRVGSRVCDILASLNDVPLEAVVDEVLDELYSETDVEGGDGIITIEFHEEVLKK